MRYFDLYHGAELKSESNPEGKVVLSFDIEAHGYGALLATKAAPDAGILALIAKMKEMTAKPLASYSHEWTVLQQQIVPITATKPPSAGSISTPGRYGKDSGRKLCLQGAGNRDRGIR